MNTLIRNQSDLRAEIFRLQQTKLEKQIALKQHFNSPKAVLSTVITLISSGGDSKADDKASHQDWVGFLSRFIIPIVLNKTLFRGSGFIMKALVGLVSQKASNYVSTDTVSSVFTQAKGFIGGLFSKKPAKPTPSFKKIKKD